MHVSLNLETRTLVPINFIGVLNAISELLKPLSHWTATVLRQLATDIASGSQSSLETVASDS